jgi:hypothetical protein
LNLRPRIAGYCRVLGSWEIQNEKFKMKNGAGQELKMRAAVKGF